jgi:hypothetical protein
VFVCCVLYFVRLRSLRRADHSSRGILLTMVRRCVWSRNLVNEEAIARAGLQSQKKNTPKSSTVFKAYLFTFFTFPLSSVPLVPPFHTFRNFLRMNAGLCVTVHHFSHSPQFSKSAFRTRHCFAHLFQDIYFCFSTKTHFHTECCDWAVSLPSHP